MTPEEKYVSQVKKLYDDTKNVRIADTVRDLVQEFKNFDIISEDWKELYGGLLRNLEGMRDKWDVVRYIYGFLNTRYDYTTAIRVTWKITKRFRILFERGRYVDFYLPTLACIELFEELSNANTNEGHTTKADPGVQLTLTSIFSRVQGVRA